VRLNRTTTKGGNEFVQWREKYYTRHALAELLGKPNNDALRPADVG
jgi:hypothetical protein